MKSSTKVVPEQNSQPSPDKPISEPSADKLPANELFGAVNFSHAFQPILANGSLAIESYEVLIRGSQGEPPYTVFEQVSETDHAEFDQYNRERAIALAMRLGLTQRLNLNFLPSSLLYNDGAYLQATIDAAASHSMAANKLVIELTETQCVEDVDRLIEIVNHYRRTGLTFSIDDFGSGYAGLNLLADLQPEQLKLDRRLMDGIDKAGPRQSIVTAICNICLDLGITVLAEGVETEEEYFYLRDKDIDLFQGYYFARPGFEQLPMV